MRIESVVAAGGGADTGFSVGGVVGEDETTSRAIS